LLREAALDAESVSVGLLHDLRDQVAQAGSTAMTVFAADKLSDILGLGRGLRTYGLATLEARLAPA